jgi:hypothetical protein
MYRLQQAHTAAQELDPLALPLGARRIDPCSMKLTSFSDGVEWSGLRYRHLTMTTQAVDK